MPTLSSSARRPTLPLHWVQLALYLAGDVAWIYAWGIALGVWIGGAGAAPAIGVEMIVVLSLTAAILTRLIARQATPRVARVAIAALGLLVALALGRAAAGLQPFAIGATWAALGETMLGWRVLAGIALAFLAWWRGIAAGRSALSVDAVESEFRGGVSALVALFLVALLAGASSAGLTNSLVALALVVLFAGLLGMPLARVLHLGGSRGDPNSPPLQVGQQWLGLLLGTILGLLVVAILLASVLTFERLDLLLSPLVQALQLVVYLIALPLGFVVEGLIDLLRPLLSPNRPLPPPTMPFGRLVDSLRSQSRPGNGAPEILGQILIWLAIALVAALVVWLLARTFVRSAERRSIDGVEETHEVVWSWSEIKATIARWLADWRAGRRRSLAALVARRRSGAPSTNLPLTPRELYRELLRMGASAGQRRARAETPNEYERALARLASLAAGREEVHVVTDVYVQDCYAAEPPPPSEVADAREALRRLQDMAADPTLYHH
jgi:hypothetical protein